MFKRTKDPLSILAAEAAARDEDLAVLKERRVRLSESHITAQTALAAVMVERRELLINGAEETPLASEAAHAAERKVRDLGDALAELDQRIARAEARREEAHLKVEAERIAAAHEAQAKEVAAAASKIDEVLEKQLAPLIQGLRHTMRSSPGLRTPAGVLEPDEMASITIAEALHRVAPWLFSTQADDIGSATSVMRRALPSAGGSVTFRMRSVDQPAEAKSAQSLVEDLIVTPLRARAEAIRRGETPAALPAFIQAEPKCEPKLGERHVVFRVPVRYIGLRGEPVLHPARSARVPEVVAEAAIEQGLAVDADAEEGRLLREELHKEHLRRTPTPMLRLEDATDLGFDLQKWAAAERDLLMAEWHAKQKVA